MIRILSKKMVKKLDGISQREAWAIIAAYNECVHEALLEGHKIYIKNVVSLELELAEEKPGYDGFSKKPITVPARWRLLKVTSEKMRSRLKKKPVYGK